MTFRRKLRRALASDALADITATYTEDGGGGAPTDATYLVGSSNGDLSAEIVVGTSPGGELGGTWSSPTVDATHSGSSHAATQAAAEATAAAALTAHTGDTVDAHDASAISFDTGSAWNPSLDTVQLALYYHGDPAGISDPHEQYRLESAAIQDYEVQFQDNTSGDVSTSAHGYVPKLPGGTSTFLRADGSFAAPIAAAAMAGIDGEDGPMGPPGPQGEQGVAGDNGAAGATGATGERGPIGLAGDDGEDGWPGVPGAAGAAGAAGANGAAGAMGVPGLNGDDGDDWYGVPVQSVQALQGFPGDTSTFLRADGTFAAPPGGSPSGTTVEVNLSATATWRGEFTITDAAISTSSKVLCWQAPGAYTGKGTRADEAEMQPVSIIAVTPATGSASVSWQTPPMITHQPRAQASGQLANAVIPALKDPDAIANGPAVRIGKVRGNVKFTYMVLG